MPPRDQETAKLEGLAIGLEQRGEKSAAHQVRWALKTIERLRSTLELIADIGEGSRTANSLPNTAKLARAALKESKG